MNPSLEDSLYKSPKTDGRATIDSHEYPLVKPLLWRDSLHIPTIITCFAVASLLTGIVNAACTTQPLNDHTTEWPFTATPGTPVPTATPESNADVAQATAPTAPRATTSSHNDPPSGTVLLDGNTPPHTGEPTARPTMPATTRQATIGTQNVPLREQADYLTEPIDPCTPIANSTKEPCQPDSYWLTAVTGGTGLGPNWDEEPTTIREQLDGTSILSVPHIVLRGTYIPDTARCQSPIKIRTPRYADPDFYPYSDEMRVIHCYADVRVNEYMVGTGPPTLTLMVTTSHYWKSVFLDYAAREREAGRNPPPLEEMEEKLRKIDETILIHGYDPLVVSHVWNQRDRGGAVWFGRHGC